MVTLHKTASQGNVSVCLIFSILSIWWNNGLFPDVFNTFSAHKSSFYSFLVVKHKQPNVVSKFKVKGAERFNRSQLITWSYDVLFVSPCNISKHSDAKQNWRLKSIIFWAGGRGHFSIQNHIMHSWGPLLLIFPILLMGGGICWDLQFQAGLFFSPENTHTHTAKSPAVEEPPLHYSDPIPDGCLQLSQTLRPAQHLSKACNR